MYPGDVGRLIPLSRVGKRPRSHVHTGPPASVHVPINIVSSSTLVDQSGLSCAGLYVAEGASHSLPAYARRAGPKTRYPRYLPVNRAGFNTFIGYIVSINFISGIFANL
jgi:hypothetical protein